MTILELSRFAFGAVVGSRLRSGLSLLGVAIGVASVILLTALGEGARRYVIGQFATIGTDLLVVVPGRTETTGMIPGVVGVPNDLTLEDALAVERQLRQARRIAPLAMATETVSHGERRRQVAIIGTSHNYLSVLDMAVSRGEFLPEDDITRGANIAVLGHTVAQELFPGENPVGQVVRIGEYRMRVIGVQAEAGTQLGADRDETVIIPAATALRIFNKTSLFRLMVQVDEHTPLEAAQGALRNLLMDRHGEEDFTILSEEALVSTFSAILAALTVALGAIAAISLTVAGLGIMNVMLVSVSERTGEIGLLRALGVERHQILAAFLTEAIFLSGIGGLTGLAVGWGATRLMVQLFPALPATPPTWAVVASLTVSLGVGGFFGLLPARKASRLDPVEALGKK